MATPPQYDIRTLVELKKEHEKLQEMVNFLQMENFEYGEKCIQLENIIANVQKVIQNNPKNLLDASEYLCGVLKASNTTDGAIVKENSANKSKNNEKLNEGNLVVVKPHMVNGTILSVPTINLTRVSELHLRSHCENNSERTVSTINLSSSSDQAEAGPSNAGQDFSSDNQTTHMEDISEASSSKSPSHSTVLSGTFQEVKIFLNQVSQENPNEEARKNVNHRRRAKQSRKK